MLKGPVIVMSNWFAFGSFDFMDLSKVVRVSFKPVVKETSGRQMVDPSTRKVIGRILVLHFPEKVLRAIKDEAKIVMILGALGIADPGLPPLPSPVAAFELLEI
jgi:hypothetical protein